MHGTPGSRLMARPRAPLLGRMGIYTVVYDRPGNGESTRHPGRTVADAAQDVRTIMNALGHETFGVVGQSGGGPHALAVAAVLGRDVVTRAGALVSPGPIDRLENWSYGMAVSNKEAYGAEVDEMIAGIRERAERLRINPESILLDLELTDTDQEVLSEDYYAVRALVAASHQEAVKHGPDGWIDDCLALRKHWGFELADVNMPVTLWCAEEDSYSPPGHSKYLAEQIGDNAQVVVGPGLSHFSALDMLANMMNHVANGAELPITYNPRRWR